MKDLSQNGQPIRDALAAWMRSAFAAAFPAGERDWTSISVAPSKSPEFGDYQCNDAMPLAKVLKMPPRAIAQAVVDAAPQTACLANIEVAGPGFINLHLDDGWLAGYLEQFAADEKLGVPCVGEGQTVVMDYGSPNITKPLHIGHLRSHNIGSALDRLYRCLGYRVIADNHLGDWGTQFGITIMGFRHFGDEEKMRATPLEELERVYVLSHERSKEDADWKNRCRQELVKLQAGDPENRALWQRFITYSIEELERTYRRIGIKYDLVRGESYYHDKLPGVVDRLEKMGLAVESEGATVVFLEEEGLPVCIVRKSDGAFNYATTDIATALSRSEEFSPDRIVYITDERQQLHFRQFFAICCRMGLTTRMDHVWFGLMRLKEGVISTREGNTIPLDTLFDKAEELALELVKSSNPDMDAAQQAEVARAVGIGAVKYADLCQNPQTVVTFDPDKAMALDGNSGPYLQYACARISSVRDKYAERFPGVDPETFPIVLGDPIERTLATKLVRFPEVVVLAAETYKPSVLAEYLYELSQTYSTFYQNVPFLKAEEGVRESRVRLCMVVAKVLRRGLDLLGMETPERI